MNNKCSELLNDVIEQKLEQYAETSDEECLKQALTVIDKDTAYTRINNETISDSIRSNLESKKLDLEIQKLDLEKKKFEEDKLSKEKEKTKTLIDTSLRIASICVPLVLFGLNAAREKRNLIAISNFERDGVWTTTAGKSLSKKAFDNFKL